MLVIYQFISISCVCEFIIYSRRAFCALFLLVFNPKSTARNCSCGCSSCCSSSSSSSCRRKYSNGNSSSKCGSNSRGVIIGTAQEEILSGLKSLATLLVLTESVVLAKYEELKNQDDKYLLLGNVGSNFDLSTQFEAASYQEAVAWIQSGGSVYTPFSFDAMAAITGAGYSPCSSKGIFETAEFHVLRHGAFGLYHYHAFANGSKVPGVHAFFSL